MESTSAPSHKLFPKFAPFRKKQVRHARSEDVLSDTLRSINKSKGSPQLPLLTEIKQHQITSPETSEQAWSIPYITEGSEESLNLSSLVATKPLPPYTPIPVPGRTSSAAKREAKADDKHGQRQANGQALPKAAVNELERDDISLISSRFDDRLLRPRSPVSSVIQQPPAPPPVPNMPRANESPILGRASTGNHKPYQPQLHATSSHIGRSVPPTPAYSDGKEHSVDQFPGPPQHRVLSPPPSIASYNIAVPTTLSQHALAQLQTPSADRSDVLETELDIVDDPDSWNVIKPNMRSEEQWDKELYSLEKRAQQLYSAEHLHILLEDTDFHSKFSTFLRRYRPWRLPILAYYWDACKALRALNYANSLAQSLSGREYDGCPQSPGNAENTQLQHAASHAFQELLGDDLHWYIAQTYIEIVGAVMNSRIMNTLPAPLRETSQGLAEVFCITDPTRRDNPIILASQAFTRHSGCPMEYILGRNCRFMQGPGTTIDSCRRFAISMEKGEDHSEIFVNYRRDGSPFLSLVMNAQLIDSRGNLRYYLGAQVDVSGLLKNCSGLDSLTRLVEQRRQQEDSSHPPRSSSVEPIKPLSEMFNGRELDTISKFGGVLQRSADHELQAHTSASKTMGPGRVLLADGDSEAEYEVEEEKEDANVESVPAELPLTELNLRGVYKYVSYFLFPA
ncbi:hypothetical protein AC578_8354 [Pseudocercospora eumusae]|uniref:PAS domain-containing protein n=1 Tax=Pseudocercospora eumusae TaxID=321146 RepID=A0A139HRY6_9PEZI|nr:hypothetical protein AC578_8354 [Pseudocercospora eumusae]